MTEYTFKVGRPQFTLLTENESIAAQLQDILGSCSQLTCCQSGPQMLNHLGQSSPDLILLDSELKLMDCFTVLQLIKNNTHLKQVPVIMIIDDLPAQMQSQVLDEGVTDFLRLPFIAHVARQRLDRILWEEYLQHNLEQEVSRQTALARQNLSNSRLLFDEMVLALAQTIDAKDRYTRGHSQRVADYASRIAAAVALPPEQIKNIYYMGLLHDIGKIGIPGQIINKPDKLSDEEYRLIKSHPLIGYEILRKIKIFPDLAVGARWHHERYDGQGYPDGLKGDAIPEPARIIAVADTYDTMSSRRSYRDILPQATIRAEILKCSGTQFDPRYAAAMVRIIDADRDYKLHEQPEEIEADRASPLGSLPSTPI